MLLLIGTNNSGSDIAARFLETDGEIRRELMPDLLHPSRQGYDAWADALRAPLRELLEKD